MHAPHTTSPRGHLSPDQQDSARAPKMSRARGLRAAVTLLAAAALVASAGCTSRAATEGEGEQTAGTPVTQFAIVTPALESDHGWNQQGLVAARAAAEQLGITLDEHANVGYDNPETILTQVAQGGNQLVIAHASGFNTAGHRVGTQTGVPTLVVDIEQNVPGKVATVIPQPEQGAYLAGIAAAMQTQTGTIGIVASAENLNWFLMAGGFAQGVHSVDPSIKIVMAYIGAAEYDNVAGGANATKQVIAAGADVIMGLGNGSTVGYLQAIETANTGYPISYVATIGDVTDIVQNPDTVLTSALWNFTDTYVQAIRDFEAGTFGTKTYDLTVKNGGLTLKDTPKLTPEMKAAVEQATKDITDGTVKVKRTTDKNAVQEMLNNSGS